LPQFVSLSSGKQFHRLNLGKAGISAGQAGIESMARDILRRAGVASYTTVEGEFAGRVVHDVLEQQLDTRRYRLHHLEISIDLPGSTSRGIPPSAPTASVVSAC
jgi:hypothetical protein